MDKGLEKIIDELCKDKDSDYKNFIKNILLSMNSDNKWDQLNKLNELTEKLKNDEKNSSK
ncbi:MAG: hypothetical protein CMG04_07380 [Candidatus Marinimicrobia bacterium]|nr:hypothetical protein [Candidatus Neomarinimicrobiota bacterium]|tara:strand:+ start:6222 stop:6401 length:180 start_codon:yes stop_codon:yes gene_type:complete